MMRSYKNVCTSLGMPKWILFQQDGKMTDVENDGRLIKRRNDMPPCTRACHSLCICTKQLYTS